MTSISALSDEGAWLERMCVNVVVISVLLLCLQATPIAFEHVAVVDVVHHRTLPDQDVVVQGDRILEVGDSAKVKIPAGARRVDGRGKFLIPGLWDMHTHVDDPELLELNPKSEEKAQWLPLFVVNGVTGIREMAGELKLLQGWRKEIEAGQRLGPRIWCGGPLVDGPKPMWPASIAVSNAEEGRKAVRDLKNQGADFIKAYSLLSKESFFAITDEAKKLGIPVCGHVPSSVTNLEACEAGLNSIEHLLQLDRELVDKEQVKEMRAKVDPGLDRFARFRAFAEINEKCYSPNEAQKLFARYKQLGTWIDPTLIVAYENSTFDAKDPKMLARLPYVPAYVREWWSPEKNVHLKSQNEDLRKGQQTVHRIYKRIVGDLKKAGIPLLVGSDMGGNPHCFAGWGVHDELEQLVSCGLTPMEALEAGTINPARYFRVEGRMGSVEVGKVADLVLLSADPTKSIGNTQKIAGVVSRGQWMDRKALDSLLARQRKSVEKRL
jgi:imidazolonepropionase-like amidohydrolase